MSVIMDTVKLDQRGSVRSIRYGSYRGAQSLDT